MNALSSLPWLLSAALVVSAFASPVFAQTTRVALDQPASVTPHGVTTSVVDYRGRRALRVVASPKKADAEKGDGGSAVAVIRDMTFRDGTIEIDVAGAPAAGAFEGARGFVGLAFRVTPDATRYEYFYLRPTNGRADDQVRRNHSTQYASHPDFPWPRLRKEFPEKYESYVDLESGVWTKMKIVVQGTTARLYVHDAPQPVLVVNDLKLGETEGGVALFIDESTEAHFANLRITPAPRR